MKFVNKKKALKWHKVHVAWHGLLHLKLWCQRHESKGKFYYTKEYDVDDPDENELLIKLTKITWYFQDIADAMVFKIMWNSNG